MKLIVAASAVVALLLPLTALAASPFEGTWQGKSGPAITYKMSGGTLTRSDSNGLTMNLKTDGSFNAVPADTANASASADSITSLSVHMKSARTMVETAKHNGKVIGTLTSTVSADGKSMTLVSVNELTHKTTTYHATKM
jgi:hypothetical protein